jgi:signal peptidase II
VRQAYFVPTHFVRFLKLDDETKKRFDISSLENVWHTGAPCPPEVKKQIIDWWGRWLAVALAVVLLDQLSKFAVTGSFALHHSQPLTSFFNLVRVHNSGAAFSFLAGASGWQRWFFVTLGTVASLFIVWLLKKHPTQTLFCLAVSLIMGGAIGNVIDRLLYGHVVDFVQLHYAGWYFPAFNVADSAITLGAILLIVDELRRVRRAR